MLGGWSFRSWRGAREEAARTGRGRRLQAYDFDDFATTVYL